MYNINHLPGLRSLLLGLAIYKATSAFTSYFKDSINPSYTNNKVHYDAAISFIGAALTGSSISVNVLLLAEHYIWANNFFSDETKKKYYLNSLVMPAALTFALGSHVQEISMAAKAVFDKLVVPAMSKLVLPAFYAKCTTILSAATLGALGYIGVYFLAPAYLIHKASTKTDEISNWSFDKACLVLSMKEGRTAEENEVVKKYKDLRHSSMNLEGVAGRDLNNLSIYEWLNSRYVDQEGYNKFSELQKYIEVKKLNLGQMTKTDQNRNFLQSINSYSSNSGLAYMALGTAGVIALFAPSFVAIPLSVFALSCVPVTGAYSSHIKARYSGEIDRLLKSSAPAPERS